MTIIWPYCQTDTVCRTLMMQYLGKRKLMLLKVISRDGENALLKTTRIKKCIRSKYSESPFANCTHTPGNNWEYKKDLEALTQADNFTEFENPTVVGNFTRFEKTPEKNFVKCALSIERFMSSVSFEFIRECILETSEPYKLILIDDDVHDAKFTAGIILDILPDYSLEKAYYIALGVNYWGNFPVFISDSFEKYDKIKTKFSEYQMEVI